MIDLLSSLIELFGAISAIIIAFIALLYEAIKKRMTQAKTNLIEEIRNTIGHPIIKTLAFYEFNSTLIDTLQTNCDDYFIDKNNLKSIINFLTTEISNLRTAGIQELNNAEAGSRAKKADQIERTILREIQNKLDSYNKANSLSDELPFRTKLAIGFPMFIALSFVLIKYNETNLLLLIEERAIERLILGFVLLGFGFVFLFSINTLNRLKDIEIR